MIKLIATDMDGTLLDSEGKINDEFDYVFNELIKRDIKFVAASGRQYYKLKENFKKHADDIIFLADNGTMVMSKDEKLYSKALNKDHVKGIIKDAKEYGGVNLVLSGEKKAYIDTDKKEILEELEKYYKEYEIVEDLYEVDADILKIAIYIPKDVKGAYNNYFGPRWGEKTKVSVSGEVWMDIYNKATNKGIALRMIQEKFDIKRDETLVFGDYFNDSPMLKEAKYNYAMENAPEEFKKEADYIAKSNDENGVLEVIKEKINLSKPS